MLTKAKSLEDGLERSEALARATEFVMADYPMILLYHFHLIVGYREKVGSFTVHPRGWITAMQAVPKGE